MTWSLVLDLLGTFFFAISGCLLAASRGFDIVGSLLLGSLTGLGSGVVPDLIIGVSPTAFAQPVYLIPPAAAALLVYFLVHGVQRFPRTLLVFDAGGPALFRITGAVKLHYGAFPTRREPGTVHARTGPSSPGVPRRIVGPAQRSRSPGPDE